MKTRKIYDAPQIKAVFFGNENIVTLSSSPLTLVQQAEASIDKGTLQIDGYNNNGAIVIFEIPTASPH